MKKGKALLKGIATKLTHQQTIWTPIDVLVVVVVSVGQEVALIKGTICKIIN